MKIPAEIEKIIEISDPVYTFCEVINHIDPKKYMKEQQNRTGRPRYDSDALLRVILFSFMENGYMSTREIEKSCKYDIRYMFLLDGNKAPSHMTIDNFMNNCLSDSIEEIFRDINAYIFAENTVDTEHVYIDGTKITANANKYSWVWKKHSLKQRTKTFEKITVIINEINNSLSQFGVKIGTREEYAIEYLGEIIEKYKKIYNLDPSQFVYGKGHRKTTEQRNYEKLCGYRDKLKEYAEQINIAGDNRNSYSKTDNDATFMRMKTDYMGNDQLLPGYNVQFGVCDEYISVYDVQQYASDTDCFIPLMERFNNTYGKYPGYPVADAGYGSFNNYLYCEEHGMEKYMKFTMFDKETKDEKYQNDKFRAVNFPINENGNPVCPNGKEFRYYATRPVRGNKYGRTEEIYKCYDCTDCPYRSQCTKSSTGRTIRLNEELTKFHAEVVCNLNSVHGGLLRMNRSIQSEGAFGTVKWNRSYTRARRRGIDGLKLEIGLIAVGFNLHKFHAHKNALENAA